MKLVINKTDAPLNLRIGAQLAPHGQLEISDADAEILAQHPLLSFEDLPEAQPEPEAEKPAEPAPEAEVQAAPSVDEVAAAEAELAKAQADLEAAKAQNQENK